MKFAFDEKSLAKFQKKLEKEFPRAYKEEGRKILKTAVTELRNDVKAAAPRDEGDLQRSIYVKVLRDKYGEPHAADVRIKTGKKAQKKNRDGWYWRLHEYGTVKMDANPFVYPTLERFKPKMKKYTDEYLATIAGEFNKP
jgi:HK97 gp10 family phage protein